MSIEHDVAETLDVTGQNCPIPVVRTKQTIDDIAAGEALEVLATDSGSVSDIAGWAETAEGVELLDQEETEDGGQSLYRHYVAKTD